MNDQTLPEARRLADTAGTLVAAVRRTGPLVQCLTNSVVTNITANVLLALGAAPAMVDIPGEAGMFARIADGVLVNLGTPSSEQRDAMREAVAEATRSSTPWVLDPVAIGALPIRTELGVELAGHRPTAIRGNASEILALAGAGAGGRGVDATDSSATAAPVANALARSRGSIVAVSGARDLITDGEIAVRVANGDELLTRMTGGGCALGAVIVGFLAVRGEVSTLDAVVAAHVVYGIAAERAAEEAAGPGSFSPRFLDALATLSPDEVAATAKIQVDRASAPDSKGPAA